MVGDDAFDRAVGQLHAILEALSDPHCAGRREAQFPAGFLRERGCREGCGGPLDSRLQVHRRHAPGQVAAHGVCDGARQPLVHLSQPPAGQDAVGVEVAADRHAVRADPHEGRPELAPLRGELRFDVPIGGRLESAAGLLALHDQPDRDALDPPRAEPRPYEAPDDARELVAEETVEDTAALLGAEEVLVDLVGVPDGVLDGLPSDFVERDPAHRHARLQDLAEVIADRLPLPVRVCRQQQLVRILQGRSQLGEPLGCAHDVDGLEVVLDVHTQLADVLGQAGRGVLGAVRQVPNVAVAGLDVVVGPQEPFEGDRLGGRLDDNE